MKWKELSSFVGILEHWQVNREGGSPPGHGLTLWETRALEAAAGPLVTYAVAVDWGCLVAQQMNPQPLSFFFFFIFFFFAEQQFLENVYSQES